MVSGLPINFDVLSFAGTRLQADNKKIMIGSINKRFNFIVSLQCTAVIVTL
jgi:hypothetical protein